jgi:glutamate carboxypeptidase
VEGGGPVNIVPDRAACRFNLRVLSREDQRFAEERLAELMAEASRAEGILLGLSGGFGRPPRILDPGSVRIYEDLARCGSDLGARLAWETSGGASDANLLAAAGLPLADGLGAPGGGLHTSQEYVLLDGLAERAELAALFLMKLGAGEIDAGAFRAGT